MKKHIVRYYNMDGTEDKFATWCNNSDLAMPLILIITVLACLLWGC